MKRKFIFLLLSSLTILSCNNLNTTELTKLDKTPILDLSVYEKYIIDLSRLNKNNPKTGITASFIINKDLNFKTKGSKDPIEPKDQDDVKSYDMFLTSDFEDPFAVGANIFGTGVRYPINNSSNPILVTMYNVPQGGPYYLAIAAFDDTIAIPTRQNITKSNPLIDTLLDENKKWAISTNCLTVDTDKNLIYSDLDDKFNVTIKLEDGIPNELETEVNIISGGNGGVLSVI